MECKILNRSSIKEEMLIGDKKQGSLNGDGTVVTPLPNLFMNLFDVV